MKKLMQILVLSVSVLFCNGIMAEPTVKEIYQTAKTNKEQALTMIDQVIDAHPKSAKAYFVKTELLLSMKRISEARDAYYRADKLDSTFGYADSGTLTKVRNALGIKPKSESISNQNIIIVCGIVICGILIIWFIVRKREPQTSNNMNRPLTPFNPAPSNTSTASAPVQSGGATSGSGIMGSLATGAAVGVGAVAGAALANHFINGNHSSEPTKNVTPEYTPSSDFGVSSDSWDSGSSSDSSSSDSSSDW